MKDNKKQYSQDFLDKINIWFDKWRSQLPVQCMNDLNNLFIKRTNHE